MAPKGGDIFEGPVAEGANFVGPFGMDHVDMALDIPGSLATLVDLAAKFAGKDLLVGQWIKTHLYVLLYIDERVGQ